MSSFRKEYDGLADAIVTRSTSGRLLPTGRKNAIVMDAANAVDGRQIPPYYYTDIAAWDTGAQFSFISPRIVEGLGLKSCGKGQYMGIGGDQESDIFKVHIGLSNGEIVRDLKVFCTDLDDYDVLLSMDVIKRTDFLITNPEGKTTFQFRTPSEGGVEL